MAEVHYSRRRYAFGLAFFIGYFGPVFGALVAVANRIATGAPKFPESAQFIADSPGLFAIFAIGASHYFGIVPAFATGFSIYFLSERLSDRRIYGLAATGFGGFYTGLYAAVVWPNLIGLFILCGLFGGAVMGWLTGGFRDSLET
jgi:hypothetical protein